MEPEARFLKGVNLGGWLVLERWITPTLFQDVDGWDEYSFCTELGDEAVERINSHRLNFITPADFVWMAKHGLNSVRLPVGFWIFGDEPPFLGGIEYVDRCFEYAAKAGLSVLLDLHGAPGSQNGYKHSGKEGKIDWHKDQEKIHKTLEIIERLAQRYKDRSGLLGIELLNEPDRIVPRQILTDFYRKGYEVVRKYCGDNVAVVISDAFRPLDWQDSLPANKYKNVIQDTHLYQAHSWHDKRLTLDGHIDKAKHEWSRLLSTIQEHVPAIIGEWSLGLNADTKGVQEVGRETAYQRFAQAQLETFDRTHGWYYWTYKTEIPDAWSFRYCVEQGRIRLT